MGGIHSEDGKRTIVLENYCYVIDGNHLESADECNISHNSKEHEPNRLQMKCNEEGWLSRALGSLARRAVGLV